MDDAQAAMLLVAAVLDEPRDAGAGLRRRHAVQVVPAFDSVLASSQLSDFSPVDASRGKVVVWSIVLGDWPRSRGRCMDWWSVADPPTWIRRKAHDIRHLALEGVGV